MKKINVLLVTSYFYLAALAMFSFSILDFFAQNIAVKLFPSIENSTNIQFIIGGIFFLIIGILDIVIGYKIFKGNNIFRIIVIIISTIGLLWSIYGLVIFNDIFSTVFLVINLFILYTLIISKNTVKYFIEN